MFEHEQQKASFLFSRHCEERSDVAISMCCSASLVVGSRFLN